MFNSEVNEKKLKYSIDALVKAQETGQIEKIVSAVEKPEFYK